MAKTVAVIQRWEDKDLSHYGKLPRLRVQADSEVARKVNKRGLIRYAHEEFHVGDDWAGLWVYLYIDHYGCPLYVSIMGSSESRNARIPVRQGDE